ncbi:MAG: short-chain fatty acid transporter, partial [Vicinamibacteria bacterium]|nr:short-chain fatty acid transporter [Vicinamibacteria bacterium]
MNVPSQDPIARFSHALGNFVPDAISASVILLGVVVAAALAIGNPPTTVVDAYYRGLWMLLPFTMQMTLILVLSAVVSTTPLFRTAVVALADLPRTLTQVVALAVGLGATLGYFYWGLGVALAPIIAIHFSAAAERKRISVDFPFLLAAVSASNAVWQFGLSSSPALLMATPGHFLDATVGVLSLRSTIWSLPAVLMVLAFPVGVVLLTIVLMPRAVRPLSAFPEAQEVASILDPDARASQPEMEPAGLAAWAERSRLIPAMLAVALVLWLYHHFVTRGHSLDLNAMNTLLLM